MIRRFPGCIPNLSVSERKVAEGLLQAKRNKEIAATMGITLRTAKQYMCRLFAKMGLTNGWKNHEGDGRVKLVMLIHQHRKDLDVRCQACGEL